MSVWSRISSMFGGTEPQPLALALGAQSAQHAELTLEESYRVSRAHSGLAPAGASRIHYVTAQEHEQRGYKAASPSRMDPWSASSGDAWQELRQDRPALVARAMQLSRDVGIFRRALEILTSYVVGSTGFAFKSDVRNGDGSPDAFAQGLLERGFRRWASGPVTLDNALDFPGFLRAAYKSCLLTGEVFIRKLPLEDGRLRLQLIESPCVPDRLDRDITGEGEYTKAGIVFDRNTRRVIAYQVLTAHPGSLSSFGGSWLGISSRPQDDSTSTIRIPASEIIHVARRTRVGAIRGEPLGVGCFSDIDALAAYERAELAAARANAARPVSIERSMEATAAWAGDSEGADKRIELDLSENGASLLPAGYQMKWNPISHPPGNYEPYVRACTRKIAADLGVSPWLLLEDLSQSNYVTLRASMTNFMQTVRSEQQSLQWQLLIPVYAAWLEYALLGQLLKPLSTRNVDRYMEHSWIPGRVRSLDESRDIAALKDAVSLNLMSLDDAVRSFSGKELDDVLAERVAERQKLAKLGLPDPADVLIAAATPGQNSPEDELPDEGMQK